MQYLQQYAYELNQKINAYFIGDKIKNLNDLLKVAKINKSELELTDRVFEKDFKIENLNKKLKKVRMGSEKKI